MKYIPYGPPDCFAGLSNERQCGDIQTLSMENIICTRRAIIVIRFIQNTAGNT